MIWHNFFVFDGKSSRDFGVELSGSGVFNAPRRDYESIEIPGRNGNLTFDNKRYENITVTYPASITRKFRPNIDGLRAFLSSRKGYCRLEDTYHPQEFRLGIYAGPFEAETGFLNRWGEFEVSFDCKPQRFLKSGERKIVVQPGETLNVLNPTYYTSKPIFLCYSAGDVTVGNSTVTINDLGESIALDCELEDAFEGAINRNKDIEVDRWPELPEGGTGIRNETETIIEVIPRWWTL